MKNWKRFSRVILFLTLLTSLLAGISAPALVNQSASAAPMAQAAALDVIISEVAWGGTAAASPTDEWIELHNTTSLDIPLSGWTLWDSLDGSGDINISLSGSIPANGYYLIELDDDATISDITANQTYSGDLVNGGEILYLKEGTSTIDTANISGGGWDAGHSVSGPAYSSMERIGVVVDGASAWVANNGVTRNGLAVDGTTPVNGTPGKSVIDLSLLMSVDDSALVTAGDTVVFTVSVTNNGQFTATNVIVMDLISAAGLNYQSDNGAGAYNPTTGNWVIPTPLANGGTVSLNIMATVDTIGAKTNSAEILSFSQLDPNSTPGNNSTTEDDDDLKTVNLPGTDTLNITNTVNNPTPGIGSNVVFAITVSNTSASNATGVQVDALLPAGLQYISHAITPSTPVTTYTSGSGVWNIGDLNGGTSKTLNITARVASGGTKNFPAEVSSSNGFPNAIATATVNPIASTQADLSLSMTWARSTSVAGRADLRITVKNNAVNAATNVQVRDLLPSGLTYVSHTSGMTYSESTGIWSVGTLAPGAQPTLTITVKVAVNGDGTNNFAEIWRSDQFDPDSTPGNGNLGEDDDTTYAGIPPSIPPASIPGSDVHVADLTLTQTADIGGGIAVFSITVRNTGPDDATVITVKNSTLHTSYTYVSHGFITSNPNSSIAGISYDKTTGIWTIPTLLDGQSVTLTVTTNTLSLLSVNWAQVSAVNEVDPDSLPNNCRDSVLSCVEEDDGGAPSADLFLTHTVDNPNPNVNTNVVFTITVANSGAAGTTNVQVKDLLPSGLAYVSDNGGGAYSKTSGIWAVGALANGANRSLTITAKVTAHGIKSNLAEVWRSNEADPDSTPGNASTLEDDDASATITSYRSVIINEVAWSGTEASAEDEWLELYNPSGAAINLAGWTLKSKTTSSAFSIVLSGTINSGGYFLLERGDNFTVSDVAADQIYDTTLLSDSGEFLELRNGLGYFIDTANQEGSVGTNPWPAGRRPPDYESMERQGVSSEDDEDWVTNIGNPRNGKDSDNGPIYGTPRSLNSNGLEPGAVATVPPPAQAVTLVGRLIINEFLARPGFDWNQDDKVDVFDEFIELKNIGTANIDLASWALDDEENQGSDPFTLPGGSLKPGERVIFYGLQTNILLSDGGDTVRLLNSGGRIYDAYTYSIARAENQSVCRLPDGFGDWYEDCIPTPNLTNSREGIIPSMPGGGAFESPVCQLPDTLPADFLIAECRGYGANIWHSFFWDQFGWQGDQYVPENMTKWESFVD